MDISAPYADPGKPRFAFNNAFLTPGAAITVSSENSNFLHENAYDWNEQTFWQPASGGASWLQCLLPLPGIVNYFALHSTTLGANGGSYDLQYSLDSGSTWISALGGAVFPTLNYDQFGVPTGMPVQYKVFAPVIASLWRFWMSSSSPSFVGVVAFGQDFEMERGCWTGTTPPTLGRTSLITNSKTVAGKFIGRTIIQQNISSSFKFQYLTESFIRGYWMPFMRAMEKYPFFILWNDVNWPYEAVFAWCSGMPSAPQNQNAGSIRYMSVDITFDGNQEA